MVIIPGVIGYIWGGRLVFSVGVGILETMVFLDIGVLLAIDRSIVQMPRE